MKKYDKPVLDIKSVTVNEGISTLAGWLEHNQDIQADVGITTYALASM